MKNRIPFVVASIVMFGFWAVSCNLAEGPSNHANLLVFDDFQKVRSQLVSLEQLENPEEYIFAQNRDFISMLKIYKNFEFLDPSEVSKTLDHYQDCLQYYEENGEQCFGLKLTPVFAAIVNEEGNVKVGNKIFNLLLNKEADVFYFHLGRSENSSKLEAVDIPRKAICYNYSSGDDICVSINTNTGIASSSIAHVEKFSASSYVTKHFNTVANGKPVKIQMWKGHLFGLKLTGAEISVWKYTKITTYKLRCTSLFKCKLVAQTSILPLWYPNMANQLYISWRLVDKQTGQTLTTYGTSAYEKSKKWWAGKWLDQKSGMKKFGTDYTLHYTIKDNSGSIISHGQNSW